MKRRTWFWVSLILVAFVLTCGLVKLRHPAQFPEFNDKDSSRWRSYGGDWNLQDGIYTNRADGRGDKLVAGPTSYGDYSVSSELRFDSAPADPTFGDAGLLMRVLEPQIGVDAMRAYYAALRPDDHTLIIGSMAFSFRELANTPFPREIKTAHWYRLTLSARGCTFHFSVEDTSSDDRADLSYVEKSCDPQAGQIGLRSYYARASWRNLQTRLTK